MAKTDRMIPAGTRAIFFDAGGTLFRPFPSVGHYYSEVATKHGCKVSAAEVEAAFHKVWSEHDGIGDLRSHSDEKIEKEFWRRIVTAVFKDFKGLKAFDPFFDELHDLFAEPSVWKLYPEVKEVLRALQERKFILGMVSNWDSRLLKLCEGLGIDRYFDFKVISAVFGAAKPNPKIFKEALKKANVPAGEVVHVGDSLEDDVRGAHLAGIKAIWLDRSNRHETLTREHQDFVTVVKNLRELI
ncbi:MAG: HAD-IA family hydrolase [Candidatus Omnitrophica bacterium]|nr:HAD-IA family hydrolase [Candidatus Omnitrophota bacterium]